MKTNLLAVGTLAVIGWILYTSKGKSPVPDNMGGGDGPGMTDETRIGSNGTISQGFADALKAQWLGRSRGVGVAVHRLRRHTTRPNYSDSMGGTWQIINGVRRQLPPLGHDRARLPGPGSFHDDGVHIPVTPDIVVPYGLPFTTPETAESVGMTGSDGTLTPPSGSGGGEATNTNPFIGAPSGFNNVGFVDPFPWGKIPAGSKIWNPR